MNRNRIAVSLALVLLAGSTFLGCEVPDKGTAEWHANQGYKLINDGCWDEAIEECNKAIELAPSLASAYNNRAWAYNKKGEYDLAIADCKRVTQLCPGLADAYINEAYAYKEKGQYDLFVDCCSEAIEIDANLTMPNLELFDFELQRILEALARAIEYKNEATLMINDIEQQTKQALSLIYECQQPDPFLFRPILPMFTIASVPIDYVYLMGRSCDRYSSNAEIAGNNAERHFDRVIRILSEVNRCWNFINNLCSSIGLSDSEKSYLEDALYSFERDAQAEANDFDRFISDIKEFLEDYVICIEEGNIIGEPPLGSTLIP